MNTVLNDKIAAGRQMLTEVLIRKEQTAALLFLSKSDDQRAYLEAQDEEECLTVQLLELQRRRKAAH